MYLSIDLGSTYFKAGVFDEHLKLRGAGQHSLRYSYPGPGAVEISIDEIETGFKSCIKEALDAAGLKNPASLKGISITSQAQTFTVVDRKGNPRMSFISWQDARAAEVCEKMKSGLPWRHFKDDSSFGILLPGLQVCILHYILETGKIDIEKEDKLILLPSYLVWLLSGNYCIDNNMAGMSGFFSFKTNTWWNDALSFFTLEKSQLPDVCNIGSICVRTDARALAFGLCENIPIILAGNDQTAGAYGAEIHLNRTVLITLGTAHVVYAVCESMPRPLEKIIRGNYPGGYYYKMAADSCGGNIVDWGVRFLFGEMSRDDFFHLASQSPGGCKGLLFQPDIIGAQGSWRNIGICHTKADFARSILESLARRINKMIHIVKTETKTIALLAAGGGSRQQLWLDILSRETGLPVKRTEADPLIGAAMMARNIQQV